MKWIGQHIYDLIARFRNDVYLQGVESGTPQTFISVDANKKIVTGIPSIESVGTITSGQWRGDAIVAAYGGTGLTSYTQGDVLYYNTGGTLSKLGIGTAGQVLKVNSGATAPEWGTDSAGLSFNGSTSNGILTYGNSTTADVEANLTFDGTDLLLDSTSGLGSYGSNVLHLKNTNASVGGPGIRFEKLGKTGADGDLIGQITWQGLNDADELTTFARVQVKIGDASDGAESGQFILTSANFVGDITGNVTGNASTATALETARNIGGVSFDGTANINLPGVNTAGNQDTSGNAATASVATTANTAKNVTGQTDSDVTITSDGEVTVKLDSDNDEVQQKFKITDNSDTVVFSVDESGGIFTAAGTITNTGSDADLEIQSDGNITFTLDRDNDETGQSFSFKNFTAEVANINESGVVTATGFVQDGDLNVTPGDGVAIHVDAADITDSATSASGTAISYSHVAIENPRLFATNSNVTTTNAYTVYIKGAPVASTNQTLTNSFALYVAGGTSKFNSDLEVNGDLDVTGNVLPGITYVKILPSDFMPDDVGRPAMIDDTSSDRWLESHSTAKLYAYVDIPVGFKATHVDIYGSATSAVTVYEADINSKTVTSKGTGNIGTQINITDVNSDATNYILIELAQASGEEVYGGKLTIAKI